MKINPYADHVSCPSKDLYSHSPSKGTVSPANQGNFDSITVGSQTQPYEPTFHELLTTKISIEVRHTSSREKLETLSSQIAQGNYQIDVDAIANAITLTYD